MKKKIQLLIALSTLCLIFQCTPTNVTQISTTSAEPTPPLTEIDRKVQTLLKKMTIEDKVGEMTQLSIDAISVGSPYNLEKPNRLDPDKLKKVLLDYRVGSILNYGGYAYTPEYWQETIKTIQDMAMNEKASGIPVIYGIDAIHGANYTTGSTLFPQPIAQAATWDTNMTERIAAAAAYETRDSWIPWNFSPVLDMGRDPRWPRIWETLGEDVHLVTQLGEAIIKGYEGTNNDIDNPIRVASCMKHFLGYSIPRTGKDRTPAYISERQLREYHLPSFKAAIDAGAHTIMINSGEINGIPTHIDYNILTTILRNELGFKGFAVSDWEDIGKLISHHHVAKDYREATKLAVNAGIDMAMVPMDFQFSDALLELVKDGEVSMERIDEAVGRILKVKFKLGLFENPYPKDYDYSEFNSAKHQALSYDAAKDCVTLLKNENDILPLNKNQKILVVGHAADNMTNLNGGWSRTWQGNDTQWDTKGKQTILDAVKDKVGEANAQYIKGIDFDKTVDIDAAVAAANQADIIIACLGENPYTEKPGDIKSLDFPPTENGLSAQHELMAKLAATGKPIVLVLVEGRPRIIRTIEPNADGILTAYLPGEEGGRAIADVLFGDHNPSGKLPYTYPKYGNDLVTYDHKVSETYDKSFGWNAFEPQFEFGHGLSYTNFEYNNLTVNAAAWSSGTPMDISVTVKNAGERDGKEVVQLYVTDEVASITPSVKRLRGFEKIELKAGESKTINFKLNLRDVAFVGIENKWITEPGEFTIRVGGLEEKAMYNGAKKAW